jgi:DNA invertase Pin-like site-specific DNA recombinase
MAGLAEFERDLIRERVKSGLAAAKANGKRLGRRHGQGPSDKNIMVTLPERWTAWDENAQKL